MPITEDLLDEPKTAPIDDEDEDVVDVPDDEDEWGCGDPYGDEYPS